jgi:hypothetical protein
MKGRDARLAPLLQSWQHFLMIIGGAFVLSCVASTVLARSASHPLFLTLPDGARVARLLLWCAAGGWECFAASAALCCAFYFLGRAYRVHLALFLLGAGGLLAHLALLGLAARRLLPPARKRLLVALLTAIARDDSAEVRRWKAGEGCAGVVGCSAAAVRFLGLRAAAAFWAAAGSLALIVAAFAGIGAVTLLMAALRREPDARPEAESDDSLGNLV